MTASDVIIAIPSQNQELLQLCRLFIPPTIPVLVLEGRHGIYGMRAIAHLVENADCRMAVLLDEDAFIVDVSRLLSLVEWSASNQIACVGMGDGGFIPSRLHNPNAFNTFFNIINIELVRARWNASECRSHKGRGQTMSELWCPQHVLTPGVPYEFNDFEPYYCFYFWLHAVGLRMEWLAASTHDDGISTLLSDRLGVPFLLHAWYSRRFSTDPQQRQRILAAALWAYGKRVSEPLGSRNA